MNPENTRKQPNKDTIIYAKRNGHDPKAPAEKKMATTFRKTHGNHILEDRNTEQGVNQGANTRVGPGSVEKMVDELLKAEARSTSTVVRRFRWNCF